MKPSEVETDRFIKMAKKIKYWSESEDIQLSDTSIGHLTLLTLREIDKAIQATRAEDARTFVRQLKERKHYIAENGMAQEFIQELINDYEEEISEEYSPQQKEEENKYDSK